MALKPKSIKFQFFGFLFLPFILGLVIRFLVQLLHVLHNPFSRLQAPQQACLQGKQSNAVIRVTKTGKDCNKSHSSPSHHLVNKADTAVVQWNHACFGIRGVSKRTGSNPVHGLSAEAVRSMNRRNFFSTVTIKLKFPSGSMARISASQSCNVHHNIVLNDVIGVCLLLASTLLTAIEQLHQGLHGTLLLPRTLEHHKIHFLQPHK
ncbi:hypothetical protein E2C01_000300 [Portunus trituberculatus]|uniref:Uncharacterized protein n=1 Tax=Portunus trituberculatus TaxID=210409 RepID=A0A5B7CG98_PORTR|nr:hypothetical protein [Portunus trituberculatus]